ncbi:FecR family protein [Cytophagales bacterium LB-30]|uniref:FecR family protein n=1 Tax=Shiella aurantiaca TaxID=3058365 RepID=A0ABT8F128_9BACT|nr:FecR family protein [Shiella aurantiaca]MDN4164009.1 FecR family protein [Shiella aurantiaca]
MKRIIYFLLASLLISSACSSVSIESQEEFQELELPDHSIVWLNKNSKITFDKDFQPRVVQLEGEAFFSVVADSTSAFLVKTELGEVKVLGTEFNVNSQADKLAVDVEHGVVELQVKTDKSVRKLYRSNRGVVKKGRKEIKLERSEFAHKQWLKAMEQDFKQLGKELRKTHRAMEKELKKEFKRGKKNMEKALK